MNLKNSMILANMMSQKPKIMYATIKGTLTENDGVFSGFSASNYLKTQTEFAPNNSTFEMLWKVKTPSSYNSHRNWIIANPENSSDYKGIAFGCNTNGDLSLYLSSTGASWNITASGNIVNLATDTDYWLKLKYDLSKYVVLVSTDGTNYTQVLSVSSSEKVFASSHIIGTNGYLSGQIWGGSIDLNNSYIKLGSTKYNLQAVVGYTVVGSPTITDGVVSGFSDTNYLSTVYGVFPDFEENFELQIKFTTGASVDNALLIGTNTSLINGFRIVSSQLNLTLRYNTAKQNTVSYTLVANTTYYAKALKKGTSLICSLYDENKVLLATNTTTLPETGFSKGNYMYIGYGTSGAFGGSIDLNETYIKINNKLWFNGQQA